MRRLAAVLLCVLLASWLAFGGNRISGYDQSYALCSINTPAANTPTQDTPELVASSWTVGNSSADWTVTTAGRLTYTGLETRAFTLQWTLSAEGDAAANGDAIHVSIAKGGTSIAASQIDRKLGAGGDHGAMSVTWVDGTVATGEYFECFVTIDDDTAAPTLTVDHGTFTVFGGR